MQQRIYRDLAFLYPLWRDARIGRRDSAKPEVAFLHDLFQADGAIKSIIDLGGSVGIHSIPLSNFGYAMTIVDASPEALHIVTETAPSVDTLCADFAEIHTDRMFDSAICMWSSLSFIRSEGGRTSFYRWIREHVRRLAIFEQANYLLYPAVVEKEDVAHNASWDLCVKRRSEITGTQKRTDYTYTLTNLETGLLESFEDAEEQFYVSPDALRQYMIPEFPLLRLLGAFDPQVEFNPVASKRMIAIFGRCDG